MQDTVEFILFSCFWALVIWAFWYGSFMRVSSPAPRPQERRVICLSPPGSSLGLALLLIMQTPASWPDGFTRVAFCWAVGTGFLGIASHVLPWRGLSARHDVAERRNRSAAWAIAAAQAATALGFAMATASGDPAELPGALLGRGILSIMVLLILWGVLEWCTRVSEAITVDRDSGAACRLAALLVGLALLVGQACATLMTPAAGEKRWLVAAAPAAVLAASLPVEWLCVRQVHPLSEPQRRDLAIAFVYLIASVLLLCLMRWPL